MNVSQQELHELLGPRFDTHGRNYRKFRAVRARPAFEGEQVVSWVSSGRETTNTARKDDYVVENQTNAREQYIVAREEFESLYALDGEATAPWSIYRPNGRVRALCVDDDVMSLLSRQDELHIMTRWNEPQVVRKGDMLATPLTGQDPAEYYRIARAEFEETYRPDD